MIKRFMKRLIRCEKGFMLLELILVLIMVPAAIFGGIFIAKHFMKVSGTTATKVVKTVSK